MGKSIGMIAHACSPSRLLCVAVNVPDLSPLDNVSKLLEPCDSFQTLPKNSFTPSNSALYYSKSVQEVGLAKLVTFTKP